MKFLYGGIIILFYVLMIGYTYRTLPMKLYSIERHHYIVYQDEKYYGGINDHIWFSLDMKFILEMEVGSGTEYSLYGTDLSLVDTQISIIIFEGDVEIGSCDYSGECTDYDLTDAYDIDDLKEFVSIITIKEPNDPIIFKNATLQSFLLLETFAFIMMICFLNFGLMKHEKAKEFLSSLKDYFEKIRFLKDVEHAKKRVLIAHRGSLILGISIFLYLVYVMIAIHTL